MSIRANKNIIIILKPTKPVTPEIQKTLDDLQKVLSLQLGIILNKDSQKADQLLKIMLRNLSNASKEMKEFLKTPFPLFSSSPTKLIS